MNIKNIMIGSLVLNLMLVGLVINVKSNAKTQAQEIVKRTTDAATKLLDNKNETLLNNDFMWALLFDIKEGKSDKKSIIRKVKTARLPGKEGEEARLGLDQKMMDGKRVMDVFWARYGFQLTFDKKDRLESVNTESLRFQKGK